MLSMKFNASASSARLSQSTSYGIVDPQISSISFTRAGKLTSWSSFILRLSFSPIYLLLFPICLLPLTGGKRGRFRSRNRKFFLGNSGSDRSDPEFRVRRIDASGSQLVAELHMFIAQAVQKRRWLSLT